MKNISRQFFDKLQGKLPAKVNEETLRMLAGSMKKSDFQDETKLRQMIQSLTALSGMSITPEKEEKIIQHFRDNSFNLNDLQAIKQLLS